MAWDTCVTRVVDDSECRRRFACALVARPIACAVDDSLQRCRTHFRNCRKTCHAIRCLSVCSRNDRTDGAYIRRACSMNHSCIGPMTRQASVTRLRRQRGSTAVEFAMIFPLFFVVMYGIITYSMIFVAQQSLTLAAEEGARAALTYQKGDTPADALTARVNAVCPAV